MRDPVSRKQLGGEAVGDPDNEAGSKALGADDEARGEAVSDILSRRSVLVGGIAVASVAGLRPDLAFGQASEPIVETAAGKVRGALADGVYSFRGVRYGASTAGANRFRPPQPAQPWAGVQDALAFGASAPQRNPNPPSGPSAVILSQIAAASSQAARGQAAAASSPAASPPPPASPPPAESEDCLFLNVWTGGLRDGRRRPVMVWLHGGFFYSGSGSTVDGSRLASRGDVVVVSVNHRLNVFGFTHLADATGDESFRHAGNAGMLDIIAALQWVQQNIERFGGDPKRVMVFGPSGGGMKTSFVMASPRARGLIHRAAVQSGPGLRFMERAAASEVTDRLLKRLQVKRSEVARLRDMPVEQLLAAYFDLHWKDPGAQFRHLSAFAPVIDNEVLPRHPFHPDASPIAAGIPLLIGWNRTEMTFFMGADEAGFSLDESAMTGRMQQLFGADSPRVIAAYRKAHPRATPSQLYIQAWSDRSIMQNAILQAERQAAAGAPVYLYRFDRPTPALGGKLGAMHTLEAHYVFDNTEAQKNLTGGGAPAAALARKMSEAWVQFAANGNPNSERSGLPNWPAYDARKRPTMIFDDESRVAEDPTREERAALPVNDDVSARG